MCVCMIYVCMYICGIHEVLSKKNRVIQGSETGGRISHVVDHGGKEGRAIGGDQERGDCNVSHCCSGSVDTG